MRNLFAAEAPLAVEPDNVPEFYVTEVPLIEIREGLLYLGFARERTGASPVVKVRIIAPLPKARVIGERIRERLADHAAAIRGVN